MSSQILRDLFEQRSAAEPAGVRHEERLAAVRRRIARVRRRVAAGTATACAAVSLAVVVTVGMAGGGTGPAPSAGTPTPTANPTPSAESPAPFPEYFRGARILATASATLRNQQSATLTFETASRADLAVFATCAPTDTDAYVILRWPSGAESWIECGGLSGWYDQKHLSRLGVRTGRPTTLAFTPEPGSHLGQPPSGRTISMAVGERVPADQVPLPPAPATLAPLPGPPAAADVVTTIRSQPGDPRARRTVRIGWQPHLQFWILMQTPGDVRVRLDGDEFMRCEKWDYSPPPAPPDYLDACGEERILADSATSGKPGDTVTITVIPERVTGDWAVLVTRLTG